VKDARGNFFFCSFSRGNVYACEVNDPAIFKQGIRNLTGLVFVRGLQVYLFFCRSSRGKVYAYEVNGLGQSRHDFDDANVPSLLAIPVLGYKYYDPEIYQNTRRRLFRWVQLSQRCQELEVG
jgi:meiotically up-regulated gene 157 (Mug157) protein